MMFKYALILFCGLSSSTFTLNHSSTELKSLLLQSRYQWCPNTWIYFPDDPSWANETTQRWNIYSAPSYVASIKPGCEEDVQRVVKIATAYSIPFLTTGGGHGYGTTYAALDNGLDLDLGYFKSVQVDVKANQLIIGGSVTTEDIILPLYTAGKEFPITSCSCVGVVGATLGAGVGRFQGIHGLIIDALLSVRLVTAKGRIITASATEYSDLFWGLRGAGANFGIILSATYKITDHSNGGNVMSADLIFPASANVSYFNTLKNFQDKLPAELALFTTIFYDASAQENVISLNAVYVGPRSKGEILIKPFLDLKPAVQNITVLPWSHVNNDTSGSGQVIVCKKGGLHSIFTLGLKNVDATTWISVFKRFSDFVTATPDAGESTILIEFFPTQAVLAVPNEATAYPWRDAQLQIIISLAWQTSDSEEPVNSFGRSVRGELQVTSGYDSPAVYVNYAHGDETLANRYGEQKLDRLIGLKKKWDPKNIFGFNNALPTS